MSNNIVKYNELDNYLKTLSAGTYDLTVDCRDVTERIFEGNYSSGPGWSNLSRSKFGDKFFNYRYNNIFFNLTILVGDDVSAMSNLFKNLSLGSSPETIDIFKSITIVAKNVENVSFSPMSSINIGLVEDLNVLEKFDISKMPNLHFAKCLCENCKKLKEVALPNHLRNINDAFYDCESLKTVDLMNIEAPIIMNATFYNCGSLEKIILPENTAFINISQNTFADSSPTIYLKDEESKQLLINCQDSNCKSILSLMTYKFDPFLYKNKISNNMYEYIKVPKDVNLDFERQIEVNNSQKLGGVPADKYLKKNDFSKIIVNSGGIPTGATTGTIWYDQKSERLKIYDERFNTYEKPLNCLYVTGRGTKGNISKGTYTRDDFWRILKMYVPRGTYRKAKGPFSAEVNGQSLNFFDSGAYIYSSDRYSHPTMILFKSSDEGENGFDYSAFNIKDDQESSFSIYRAYMAEYDSLRTGGHPGYYNHDNYDVPEVSYPITIGGDNGIVFE